MTEWAPPELLRRARAGDSGAVSEALERNNGLIWAVARRYFGRGVEPEDLYQLGCVGFLKALRGYDEEFGTRFSTYAVPKIAGEIRRFLRDDGSIKVSRSLKEQAQTVRIARSRLEQTLGRDPVLSELSAETGLSPEEIAACETATASAESLQRESGEDGFTLEAVLRDPGAEERLLEQVALREAVARLPAQEREVILLRYFRGLTQEMTGRILKISQVQVSRAEKRAVTRLRGFME